MVSLILVHDGDDDDNDDDDDDDDYYYYYYCLYDQIYSLPYSFFMVNVSLLDVEYTLQSLYLG